MTPDDVLRAAAAHLVDAEDLLRVTEVAKLAGVSRRTVWTDITKGALQVIKTKVGMRHRVRVLGAEAHRYAGR